VTEPLDIMHGQQWSGRPNTDVALGNGNHRVAIMMGRNPDSWLPVQHHEDETKFFEELRTRKDTDIFR
jgi:hypothetical protein